MGYKKEKMKVSHILEKGTARLNEDCMVIQDNIFGVFDGATSLTEQTDLNGQTGGMIASQTARSVFRRNHYPLHRLACDANKKIMDKMVRHGVNISKRENLWSTSAAVVRIKEECLEWIQAGDAVILLVYKDGSHRVLVDREDHDHETLSLWKELVNEHTKGASGEFIKKDQQADVTLLRRALAPQIKKVRLEMNVHYGVLNGEKKAEQFINQGEVPLKGISDVLLFTDGLSIPSETPEKHKNFAPLVKDYLSLGLGGVKARIRKKENSDPQCLRFPRFKCHDDIAAIAVTI